MTAADNAEALREKSREWSAVGELQMKLLPHCLAHIGARVMLLIKGTPVFTLDEHLSHVLTPAQARLIANKLKIAADEAEAMERRGCRLQHVANDIPTTILERSK